MILGLAGVEAGALLAANAVRHVGWWLGWHTRAPIGAGSGAKTEAERAHAAMQLMRAA